MKNQFRSTANFFKKVSETVFLFKDLWKQHTIALLQSPLDSDKTPLITEILESVAVDDRRVVYVDTDNRAETFIKKFIDNTNLIIFTPSYDQPDAPQDYADLVFEGIEEAVAETDIRTFVIDSISRIAARSFGKNSSPSYIMKRLVDLQARHNLSLLVIAHSATKSSDRALKLLSDCQIAMSEEKPVEVQPQETAPTDKTDKPEQAKEADKTEKPKTEDKTEQPVTVAKPDAPKAASQPDPAPKRPYKPLIANPFYHDSEFWHRPDPFTSR